jgi:hypothetical protein
LTSLIKEINKIDKKCSKTKIRKWNAVDRKLDIIAVPTVRKTMEALLTEQYRYFQLLNT